MTGTLIDALWPQTIPANAPIPAGSLVASYVDHPEVHPPCMEQLLARFPTSIQVTIAAHGGRAQICDVESGAMTPASAVAWAVDMRADGIDPSCYASPQWWTEVKAAFNAKDVALPYWWAVFRPAGMVIPFAAVGNQWLGAGTYDQSIITDAWARVLTLGGHDPSGGGIPIPPIPPVTPMEVEMARPIVSEYENAEWMVSGDLTSRVWIRDDVHVYMNDTANYVVRDLPADQMALIPVVGAAPPLPTS